MDGQTRNKGKVSHWKEPQRISTSSLSRTRLAVLRHATLSGYTCHWSLHHAHLRASGLLVESARHLSSKVLRGKKTRTAVNHKSVTIAKAQQICKLTVSVSV